ncbi:hypothetical protein DK389_23180 [Methylobacterium durans]|uniref:Uncharacterized protein n=1 Tax=Methylobacterium durans TaxID=2202825 RepID=A0A2U8W9P6_9HYPH|nr:hypothetical protein DK389_23180 [Methylobacterium durans]
MPTRLALALVAGLLAIAPAWSAEDCPERFEKYGLFLQAKQSCGREVEYPLMKVMRACAKETPREAAIKLMDVGRREWARGVMRSSLGSMCAEVFAKLPPAAEKRQSTRGK